MNYNEWRFLLNKKKLSKNELQQIPARIGDAQKANINTFRFLDIETSLLCKNTDIQLDKIHNVWLNPLQVQQFDKNYFQRPFYKHE